MYKNLPNILTFSRICLVPLVVLLFYMGDSQLVHILLAGLFGIACITDLIDGYLARMWQSQSSLGRFLDPIADKVLVGAIIIMMVHFDRIDIFPALAIIIREILVSGLREYLAELRVSVPVSNLAKIKTGVQMGAVFTLLLGSKGLGMPEIVGIDVIFWLGRVLIWLAALLTIFTGFAYFRASSKHF